MDLAKLELEAAKLQTSQKVEGAKIGAKIATELDKEQRKDKQEEIIGLSYNPLTNHYWLGKDIKIEKPLPNLDLSKYQKNE